MPDHAAPPFVKTIGAWISPHDASTPKPSPRLSLLLLRAQALAPDLKTHMRGPASGWTLPEWWDVYR